MLTKLLELQNIERKLAQVRSRLRIRQSAVDAQQRRIEEVEDELGAAKEAASSRRMQADQQEVTLRSKEEQVQKLRTALNTAKSNKEYAAILTQINTHKADNAKLEEETLKIMQEIDALKEQVEQIKARVEQERQRLETVRASSGEEISRLKGMLDDLTRQREEVAGEIDPEALAVFDRIAANYDGEAMAPIEVHGKKPPYTYVCGGCYMGLTPEHANALGVRDEIRTCNNCGRILYLDPHTSRQASPG